MIINSEELIKKLEKKIIELEDTLSEEIAVKRSEVMLNKELKERIEKQELIIEHLAKINYDFLEKIKNLRIKINKLINE
tara:strand:+ start:2497 stop:2733 length:237 start_codon:yes stop_codon:yes gene_type:complete